MPFNLRRPLRQRSSAVLEELRLLRKQWEALVAFGDDGGLGPHRPFDHQRGIVPSEAAIVLGTIIIRYLVEHFGVVLERAIAVRETRRHPYLTPIVRAHYVSNVAAERRRAASDIDDDVEYRTARHAHQLSLRRRRGLIMQTAQRAL